MNYDPQRHNRRSVRLPGYDYAQAGAYFVTLVVQGRECLFGEVVDSKMVLSRQGEAADVNWRKLPIDFPFVQLGEYVVMPNHIHGVIWIVDQDDPHSNRCAAPGQDGDAGCVDAPPYDAGITRRGAARCAAAFLDGDHTLAGNDQAGITTSPLAVPNASPARLDGPRGDPGIGASNETAATAGNPTGEAFITPNGPGGDSGSGAPNETAATETRNASPLRVIPALCPCSSRRGAARCAAAFLDGERTLAGNDQAGITTSPLAVPNASPARLDGPGGDPAVGASHEMAATAGNPTGEAFIAPNGPGGNPGSGAPNETAATATRNAAAQCAAPLRDDPDSRPRGAPSGSLGAIVGTFKSITTRRINRLRRIRGAKIWQRGYYEHIVRDEEELGRIEQYIVDNPAQWEQDLQNPRRIGRKKQRAPWDV